MVFCSFHSVVLFLLSSLSLTNFLVRLVVVLVVIRSPIDQHRRSGSPYQRQLWLRREGFHLSISTMVQLAKPNPSLHFPLGCSLQFRYVHSRLVFNVFDHLHTWAWMHPTAEHQICNVPRYNTTSVESEPEWRTIYWSKAQSYIIQHCVGASHKEGITSFTDLSIITPKDSYRKQLSFCCLIRLLLLWIYVNIHCSPQSINATPPGLATPLAALNLAAHQNV